MGFITKEGLQKLNEYKYKSGGYSKLDNLINPFWEKCQKSLPRTMAPNLVTFIGFIFMILSYAVLFIYDHTFTKPVPGWAFFAAGFCQWIYQTMDAVDGKHARETKSSSPLGQLFDHGCDSFSTNFMILTAAQATMLTDPTQLVIFAYLCQITFFVSNWSEYHTHVLKTQVGNFGVTEIELIMIVSLWATGYFGPEIWNIKLSGIIPSVADIALFDLTIKEFIIYPLEVGSVVMTIYVCIDTLKVSKNKFHALLQWTPIFIQIVAIWIWKDLAIFRTQTGIILLTGGLIFSLNTSKLILCSLTEMRAPLISLEALLMLGLGYWLKITNGTLEGIYDYYLIIAMMLYAILSCVFWAHGCITQITTHLGIYCFNLQKRKKLE